jgi:hypothetical protein
VGWDRGVALSTHKKRIHACPDTHTYRYIYTHTHKHPHTARWTPDEDRVLLEGQRVYGNKWAEIAQLLEGRPENAVKNR